MGTGGGLLVGVVTIGTSHPFTVTAKDSGGNPAANYTGTITFNTNAASAVLPANYTFQPSDYGQHVFSATFNVTGTYSITATDTAPTPPITGSEGGIVVQGTPSVIEATGGTTQSTGLNHPFPSHLTGVVKDSSNSVLSGVVVTFTAPGSGASATFSNNSNVITATSNASGVVDSGAVIANNVDGTYTVTATAPGVITSAVYTLTNVETTCNAYEVTNPTDNGQGLDCGTLSYALASANDVLKLNSSSVINITFALPDSGHIVAVTGKLPTVKAGITIDGGSCDGGPNITINGSGYNGDGFSLAGGNLYNLRVANFGGKQIVATMGDSFMKCVIAAKSYSP